MRKRLKAFYGSVSLSYKLISNRALGQVIVYNFTNVHLIDYSTLDLSFMKFGKKNIKCNNYSDLPFEMQLMNAVK